MATRRCIERGSLILVELQEALRQTEIGASNAALYTWRQE
jgi:hypothetical protein